MISTSRNSLQPCLVAHVRGKEQSVQSAAVRFIIWPIWARGWIFTVVSFRSKCFTNKCMPSSASAFHLSNYGVSGYDQNINYKLNVLERQKLHQALAQSL